VPALIHYDHVVPDLIEGVNRETPPAFWALLESVVSTRSSSVTTPDYREPSPLSTLLPLRECLLLMTAVR